MAHVDYASTVPNLNADIFKLNLALSEEEFLQKMDRVVKVEKSQKERKTEISSRMIPEEKKKLTNMLHGYIKAHNIHRRDDLKGRLKT